MPRRAIIIVVAILGALAAIYLTREANCRKLLQTAEMAADAQVRPGHFGGCYVDDDSDDYPQ